MDMQSPIPFRGFDERGPVRIYQPGSLPHWRQDGCTYFVTWHLADSLPAPVLRELEHERRHWLHQHGIDPDDSNWKAAFTRLSKTDQREYERRVGTKLNDLLDAGHGSCVLRDGKIANFVAESLTHFHGERVLTGDFVVMPNHVHALMTPKPGFELEDILHSIKSYTANKINRQLNQTGALWQRESYDHIVRDFDQLEAFQQYIALNPRKSQLPLGRFVHTPAKYCPAE